MIRLAAAGAATVVLVCACGPLGVADPATGKASYTAAPPTPTLDPGREPASAGHGTPYSADDVGDALAAAGSRLPVELRSGAVQTSIAAALAARISTYDAQPYRDLVVSGSCDDDGARCDLQVKGVPAFASDRDTADFYTFSVDVETGVLTPAGDPALRGFPPDLVPELDASVRSLLSDRLTGKTLLAAQWAPAPPPDTYLLRYGTGDEEADRQVVVQYDRATNTAVVVPE